MPIKGRLEVYRTRSLRRSQRWAWRLRASNGKVVATSGEGYSSRGHAATMGMRVCRGVDLAGVDHLPRP